MTTTTTEIEYRVIPGFTRFEASLCGKIRNRANGYVRSVFRKESNYGNEKPRISLWEDVGCKSTVAVEMLVARAWGLEWAPKNRRKAAASKVGKTSIRETAEPVEFDNSPDGWSHVHRSAAKRDAAFARAGSAEDMPAAALERELRCLRGSRLMLVRPATETGLSASCLYGIV